MDTLRSRLIKMASVNKSLRPHLLPLLKEAGILVYKTNWPWTSDQRSVWNTFLLLGRDGARANDLISRTYGRINSFLVTLEETELMIKNLKLELRMAERLLHQWETTQDPSLLPRLSETAKKFE